MPASLLALVARTQAVPDAELLARFTSTRDEDAFAELIRRHGPLVLRICRRLAPAVADDALQAVFLVLARRAGSIRAPGAVAGWLVGVAGRLARRMRDAERARAARERGAAGPAAAPPDRADGDDLVAALDDELSRLPDELRDPLVLCAVLGRTHDQAAAELGSSARTLRRRLERAKAVLRARLERRGIAPAAAVLLIGGLGETTGAAPPALQREAVAGAFRLLAGEPPAPHLALAAELAPGAVRLKASAAVCACAAVLAGFGVVWSDERPAAPPPVSPPGVAGQDLIPPPGSRPAPDPRPQRTADAKAANFVVHAPTPVLARALAAEAEHQRRELALKWLGREVPAWPEPCAVRYTAAASSGGATTFTFGREKDGKPTARAENMELRGDFRAVLSNNLPHEVMHTVLASHFAKLLPRWADEGIAILAEPDDEQFNHAVRARELLNDGRAIRCRVLFRMTEYPRDMIVLYAQGYSLAHFLLNRPADGVPVLKDHPVLGPLFRTAGADGRRRLIAFVQLGADGNTAESWQKAAETVYGFKTVDDLEDAWLETLRELPVRPKAKLEPEPRWDGQPDLVRPPKVLPDRP